MASATPHDEPLVAAGNRHAWVWFSRLFLIVSVIIFGGLAAIVVALDPYDTGRLPGVVKVGVPAQGPRTAHASRGRDIAYDAAIFGNSHVQLLSPARLAGATGVPFVSLIVPATGPQEQLALLDYWLKHRASAPRAIVIGIDGYWCRKEPDMPTWQPFPFWLYGESLAGYIRGMIRFQGLEEIDRRLRYVAGKLPRARPDGYWNYEEDYGALLQANNGLLPKLDHPRVTISANLTGRFPPVDALAGRLARLPATTSVVLLRPPVHILGLPNPGSDEAKTDAACAKAFSQLAKSRPHTVLIDARFDSEQARIASHWFDHTHYRASVALQLEEMIVKAMRPN
jgi:hypothetical protein